MRGRRILDGGTLRRVLRRMAHEILEANEGSEGIALVGIHTRGIPLARRLADHIAAIVTERGVITQPDAEKIRAHFGGR